jgi:hypothetical protein
VYSLPFSNHFSIGIFDGLSLSFTQRHFIIS